MRGVKHAVLACLFVFAVPGAASAATLEDVPEHLRQTSLCMLAVLKSDPGVSHAKLGVSDEDGIHIFLEFDPDERDRWVGPTHFYMQKPADLAKGPYVFGATLPGLLSSIPQLDPNGRTVGSQPVAGLDFHVTERVTSRWEIECGVQVFIITV